MFSCNVAFDRSDSLATLSGALDGSRHVQDQCRLHDMVMSLPGQSDAWYNRAYPLELQRGRLNTESALIPSAIAGRGFRTCTELEWNSRDARGAPGGEPLFKHRFHELPWNMERLSCIGCH